MGVDDEDPHQSLIMARSTRAINAVRTFASTVFMP
jgi:hypothetical protein